MLFCIFWEFSLIPMLYIIGAWGDKNRIYASIKFLLYSFSASLIMLFGILCCAYLHYSFTGKWSFSLIDWYRFLNLGLDKQQILFIAFFIGIAVKVPVSISYLASIRTRTSAKCWFYHSCFNVKNGFICIC